MNKITMENTTSTLNLFEDFLLVKKTEGLTEKTIKGYAGHFKCIQKFYNFDVPIEKITKKDILKITESMLNSNLAPASVASYIRTLKTFFSWMREEGYTDINVKLYHAPETHKEVYENNELICLLRKPKKDCSFAEFRDWTIISLLLNCGARAKTIRFIQNRDVDIDSKTIYFRHTKNKKPQYIPLSTPMTVILKSYMRVRGGEDKDWLFPTETGTQMTENCLRTTIERYNRNRGVAKTSIHLFRHTFVKKFILDCGGNPFLLQEILGHSSLDMSKHYFSEYGKSITKNFDEYSPLTKLVSTNNKIKMKR